MNIFKEIEGFEDYEIDNDGNVKSIKRNIILKPSITKKGYKKVVLYKEGKIYHKLVHRLVAEAFLPNENNLPIINHKDENPANNHIELELDKNGNIVVNEEKSNLEWCTYKYNNTYNGRHLRATAKLIGVPRPDVVEKFSKPVVAVKDGVVVMEFPSISEARRNGYIHSSDCCYGLRRTCGGYQWYWKKDWEEKQNAVPHKREDA